MSGGEKGPEGHYMIKNNRRLRTGHTTGTCAAAASKAATIMLLTQASVDVVDIMTPKGIRLYLPIEDISISKNSSSCAVRKDGGDDIDATHGTLVYAKASFSDLKGVSIDGGRGVGRVTKKGLDQPPGNAAINRVPRMMMTDSVQEVCASYGYEGGISIVISAPEGEEIAKRTFNPRLGITGGISIIGTSGIVEPMSEIAIIETIRTEMRVRLASGCQYILAVPGNYGMEYAKSYPDLSEDSAIKCSNFIGEAIDGAVEFGAKGLLLFGNLGKLVKLAGGIMNTHSRNADCRMEILMAHAIMAGSDADTAKRIMGCISTDDALDVLQEADLLERTMPMLIERMRYYMDQRAGGRLELGVAVFSSKYGLLGMSNGTPELIKKVNEVVHQ